LKGARETLGKLVKDEELYKNITSATKTFSEAGDVARRNQSLHRFLEESCIRAEMVKVF
jgi:negative regulator of replication initiation